MIFTIVRAWALAWVFLPAFALAAPIEREPAFRDNFYDVAIHQGQSWVVGYYGTILYSEDRGKNWTVQDSPAKEALFRVVFTEAKIGWISGSYGALLHTKDRGKHWRKQNSPTEEHLFGLFFLDSRFGWAVGSRGTILRTENGGSAWTNHSIGEDVILNDVRFLDAQRGWAVGEFGRIYRSLDGGRTWTKQPSPVEVDFASGESRNLFRLLFPRSDTGWAFGLDGAILKTQGKGGWKIASADGAVPPRVKRHHLFSASFYQGRQWVVGERGTVLVSASGNHRWRPAAVKVPPLTLNGIDFGAEGFGLIVGNRGLMLRTENGGAEWKPMRVVTTAPGKGTGQIR